MSFSIKVKEVIPLDNLILLVKFENNIVKKYDVKQLFNQFDNFKKLADKSLFNKVKVDAGGYAICFDDELDISEVELWDNGITI